MTVLKGFDCIPRRPAIIIIINIIVIVVIIVVIIIISTSQWPRPYSKLKRIPSSTVPLLYITEHSFPSSIVFLTETGNISIQADIIEVIFSSFHFTRVTLAVIFHGEHFFLPELGAVIEVKLGVEAHHLKNEAQHSFFLSLHSNYLTALRSTEIKMGRHTGYAKQETTQDLVE